MCDKTNENQNEDLKAFEAALGALRPRTDRFDCRRRPLPAGETHNPRGCTNPGGHQFLCIYCGSNTPIAGRARRLAGPMALAAMTAVAAVLFAMLATRSEPQVVVQDGRQGAAVAASSVVRQQNDLISFENGRTSEYRPAMGDVGRTAQRLGADEMSYLTLRDQVLRDGVESWKSPVSPVVTAARTTEGPLGYREQLKRLLEQQNLRGS